MKKKVLIIITVILIILIIVSVLGFALYKLNIKNSYNDTVIITNDTKLYNKDKKEVGTIAKDVVLNLDDDISDTYFKIKNCNYYVNYKDIKKSNKKINNKQKYLIFNNNIKTNNKTVFYNDSNKPVITINKSSDLPILSQDSDYFYVEIFNNILKVNKKSGEVIEHKNTDKNEAEYISVLHYNNISLECSDNNCVSVENVKNQIHMLEKLGYYTISLDEYVNYLNGNIRLEEKAILLTTNANNEEVEKINKDSKYKINVVNDKIKFQDSNIKSTKNSKTDSIERYLVKNDTSLEVFTKMVEGEEVIINPTTKIPVLNYHFFYDGSIGEACNESICLDVKDFREQLDYLKNNGYRALSMQEFTDWMYEKRELPEKSVLITIDDGAMGTGKHNGNKLIPILEEYQMHATLFLISGWWSRENYRSDYLDVQSHTFDMHNYGDCGDGQVICESKENVFNDLKKSLEIVDNDNSFCFPFYHYDNKSIEAVKEAGFKLAFIGGSRKATKNDDKYKIPRYPIHKTTSMDSFIKMVS